MPYLKVIRAYITIVIQGVYEMDQRQIHLFNRTNRYMQIVPKPKEIKMLTRSDIVKQVEAHATIFGMGVEDFVITAGAALVMHGLRDKTRDVDVDLHPNDFRLIRGNFPGGLLKEGLCGEVFSIGTAMDIHVQKGTCAVDEIDGIKVMSKQDLLDQYLFLYEHKNRDPAKLANDAKARDSLIRALHVEDLQKPVDILTARDLFGKFAPLCDQLDRLKRFAVNAMPVGQHFHFEAPHDELWFAMVVYESNSAGPRWLQLYETSVKASEFFRDVSNQALMTKHWDTKLRFEVQV